MKNQAKNWLNSAQYDLDTAQSMVKARKYIYTIFMCHLALEKILKAKVTKATQRIPPKTHDLIYLANLAQLSLTKEMQMFLAELSDLSITTRYPEDFERILKDFPRKQAKSCLDKTKQVFQWIKKSIKL